MRLTVVIACTLALGIACTPHKRRAKKEPAPEVPLIKPEAGAERPTQQYSAEAFFNTTSYQMSAPTGFAFSQDGSRLLVTHDGTGIFNVYALAIDGSGETALTASTDRAARARSYFPSDDRVLFAQDGNGDELDHIFVRELDGTIRDLTPGENLKADFLGWSDDGKTFWLTTNERDPKFFDIYAYRANGYERERVYENSRYSIGAISPDGARVAMHLSNSSADSDLYLAELTDEGAKETHLTPHEGDIAYDVFSFTADGQALVYGTNEHGEFNQAWTYDIASKSRSPLIEAEWDVMFVAYSPSGRYRVAAINEDATTELTVYDTEAKRPVELKGLPDGDRAAVRFSRDESTIAFAVISDTSPADVYVASLATGVSRRLTEALNDAIDEEDLVSATVVRYPSFDGTEIPSILYRPHQASTGSPVPALVLVHGGPGGQTRRGYSALVQHLVNHGYAILGANNRGSSGYGKTFFHLDDRKHGEVDLQDIVHGRKYLESLEWVDGEHIGIIGGSYGGYMVAAALAFEPEAFDVGIDIFGVTNWERTLKSIPPWWESFKKYLYDEMGDPATDAERHRRISPLFHAEQIRRPLLVIQGANDPRVLKVESDELVEAVKKNGVPVEYVVFPDEGHGFRKRSNRIKASAAYVEFLDAHLNPSPEG